MTFSSYGADPHREMLRGAAERREGRSLGRWRSHMDDFMRDSDAFSWYMEKDPVLRSTVVAVAWLDRSPSWEALSTKLDHATRVVPLFRKRVVEPPGRLATPRWTLDHEFDLTWHLRRVGSPEPHTDQTVVDFARRCAMASFDRSRPLWEFTLMEQLEGGRAALIMKLHHSLTDGVGGMQLALLLFDTTPQLSVPGPAPEEPGIEHLDMHELVRQSIVRDWGRLSGVLVDGVSSTLPALVKTLRRPLKSASGVLDSARSIGRTVAPASSTLSPLMKQRGLSRRLDMVEVAVDDLKAAAASADGTLNDAFVAGITGGLRRYHEHHEAPVSSLRMTLPISIRTPEDPMGGNRITLIRFVVPVADPDPASRIREIHRLCRAARAEPSITFTDAIAGALNLLPTAFVGGILKHVDFLASDVPGFGFPVYLGGALLERYVSFGPTIGSAVNFTLLSYCGTCFVGMTTDTAAVPDHDLLVECVRGGFEEVLGLGGAHTPVVVPLVVPGALAAEPSG